MNDNSYGGGGRKDREHVKRKDDMTKIGWNNEEIKEGSVQ